MNKCKIECKVLSKDHLYLAIKATLIFYKIEEPAFVDLVVQEHKISYIVTGPYIIRRKNSNTPFFKLKNP